VLADGEFIAKDDPPTAEKISAGQQKHCVQQHISSSLSCNEWRKGPFALKISCRA